MKKRLITGLLAGGLMAGMLPGVATAKPPVYYVEASCIDKTKPSQLLNWEGFSITMSEWKHSRNNLRKNICEDSLKIQTFDRLD